jgi:CoA:oxalate CoA-transferase
MAHVEELKRLIQEWFDSMPGDDEIFRLFDEYRVPYAPVLTVEQAIAHPHLRDNEIVRTVNDRFLGEFDVPGFPLRFSQCSRHPQLDAPTLGEHNRSILTDYLGYSTERIEALEREGVLHKGPR